jgi:hypothetical protein
MFIISDDLKASCKDRPGLFVMVRSIISVFRNGKKTQTAHWVHQKPSGKSYQWQGHERKKEPDKKYKLDQKKKEKKDILLRVITPTNTKLFFFSGPLWQTPG